MKIAFDVDSTLIDSQDRPLYTQIELLRWFYNNYNYEIIVWSGGGEDYAQHFVDKLGLDPENKIRVIEKGSEEVDIAVDDQQIPPEGVKAKVIIKV